MTEIEKSAPNRAENSSEFFDHHTRARSNRNTLHHPD